MGNSATTSWSGEHNTIVFKFPIVLGADDYHNFTTMARLLGFLTKAKVSFMEVDGNGKRLQADYPHNAAPYAAVFYVNYTPEVVDCIEELKRQIDEAA